MEKMNKEAKEESEREKREFEGGEERATVTCEHACYD